MEIVQIDLNDKSTINLNTYIQVQQGDKAVPLTLVFKYNNDTVDMNDGKLGFISGMTANNNNVEFENIGNSAGQCIITLNSYAFQDAGNYQYLYVGIKDSEDNVITSVPASLNVLENKLNTNLDTGAYRDDWQKFKDGLTDDVNQLSGAVNNIANKANETENNLNAAESGANSATSQALSAASYATSAANSSTNNASQAIDRMEKGLESSIVNISDNLNAQIEPLMGKKDAADVLALMGKSSLDDLPFGRYACNGWNSNMKGQYPAADWIDLDVGYDCTNGAKTQFIQTNENGIYYRSQNPNSYKWTKWYHLGDDKTYISNDQVINDTNLMNGTTGEIKAQRLGNVVLINLIAHNASSNDVIYQLPQLYRPNSQRQAASAQINSNGAWTNFLTINTDGTLSISQLYNSDNSQMSNIDCNTTFTYFIN